MVEEADGHEAEDELWVIPVPEVLMEDDEEQEDKKKDPFTSHSGAEEMWGSFTESVAKAFQCVDEFLCWRSEADDESCQEYFA